MKPESKTGREPGTVKSKTGRKSGKMETGTGKKVRDHDETERGESRL